MEESQGLSLTAENVDEVGNASAGCPASDHEAGSKQSECTQKKQLLYMARDCQHASMLACCRDSSRSEVDISLQLQHCSFVLICALRCCSCLNCPQQVLGEIRPYLVGTGGGELILDSIDGVIVKIKITGPAANVMTVRVAVTQKLREKIPSIAAVQLL